MGCATEGRGSCRCWGWGWGVLLRGGVSVVWRRSGQEKAPESEEKYVHVYTMGNTTPPHTGTGTGIGPHTQTHAHCTGIGPHTQT